MPTNLPGNTMLLSPGEARILLRRASEINPEFSGNFPVRETKPAGRLERLKQGILGPQAIDHRAKLLEAISMILFGKSVKPAASRLKDIVALPDNAGYQVNGWIAPLLRAPEVAQLLAVEPAHSGSISSPSAASAGAEPGPRSSVDELIKRARSTKTDELELLIVAMEPEANSDVLREAATNKRATQAHFRAILEHPNVDADVFAGLISSGNPRAPEFFHQILHHRAANWQTLVNVAAHGTTSVLDAVLTHQKLGGWALERLVENKQASVQQLAQALQHRHFPRSGLLSLARDGRTTRDLLVNIINHPLADHEVFELARRNRNATPDVISVIDARINALHADFEKDIGSTHQRKSASEIARNEALERLRSTLENVLPAKPELGVSSSGANLLARYYVEGPAPVIYPPGVTPSAAYLKFDQDDMARHVANYLATNGIKSHSRANQPPKSAVEIKGVGYLILLNDKDLIAIKPLLRRPVPKMHLLNAPESRAPSRPAPNPLR